MTITITEFRKNYSKYLKLSQSADIIITRRGSPVAKLAYYNEKMMIVDSLEGFIPGEIDFDKLKEERIMRKCN